MLVLCLSITACKPTAFIKSVTFSGPIMGTDYRISLVLHKEGVDQRSLEKGVLAAMQLVNQSMSTYMTDSELNQFNALPANQEFVLSPALQQVVSEALSLSSLTEGTFDATVKPLVDLWGFGAVVGTENVPNDDLIQQIKQYTGYEKLVLVDNRLYKKHDKVTVDLSAIAKGYAVDQVANYLQQQGVHDYLINIGGELKAAGHNQDNHVWRVGIEKPQQLGGVQQVIKLFNKAIATSGDYRNFVMIDGQAYSHTMDPRLAQPVNHKLASVSVIADKASTADGLSTALMVMGEQAGMAFAEQQDIAAFFIIRAGEQYEIRFTEKFTPYLP